MEKQIIIGQEIESNTNYTADAKVLEVYGNQLSHYGFAKQEAYGAGDGYKVAFFLQNKENVTLDFNGATLYLHGKIQPFILDNCKNITVKNVTVEYQRPPFSEGEVVEVGEDYFTGKFHKNCPYRIEDNNLIFYGEDWENTTLHTVDFMFVQNFDAETKQGKGLFLTSIGKNQPPTTRPFRRIHLKPCAAGDCVKFVGYNKGDFFSVGDKFVIGHEDRSISNVFMRNCENIYLTNYRIVNGQGMGILPTYVKNLYMDHLILNNEEDGSCMVTNSADAIHAVACSGDFQITNSVIGGMIDDALNIHSYFYHVESVDKDTLNIVSKSPDGTSMAAFGVGDEIVIYHQSYLEEKERYSIKAVETVDFNHFFIRVDREVKDACVGDMVENLSTQANLTIDHCKFVRGNSHLRIQTRGKSVIKNSFVELKVFLTGDTSYWFESSPVNDFTIENCEFGTPRGAVCSRPECLPSEKAPYYHKNVKIRNCSFVKENPVDMSFTDDIEIKDVRTVNGDMVKCKFTNCGKINADQNCLITIETIKKDSLQVN